MYKIPPAPLPLKIQLAKTELENMKLALQRPSDTYSQIKDILFSLEFFIKHARDTLQ